MSGQSQQAWLFDTINRGNAMERESNEGANLGQRIVAAGWHILRDEEVANGHEVEFQQGDPGNFHPGAEIRTVWGQDRDDAYRRFLESISTERQPAARG